MCATGLMSTVILTKQELRKCISKSKLVFQQKQLANGSHHITTCRNFPLLRCTPPSHRNSRKHPPHPYSCHHLPRTAHMSSTHPIIKSSRKKRASPKPHKTTSMPTCVELPRLEQRPRRDQLVEPGPHVYLQLLADLGGHRAPFLLGDGGGEHEAPLFHFGTVHRYVSFICCT